MFGLSLHALLIYSAYREGLCEIHEPNGKQPTSWGSISLTKVSKHIRYSGFGKADRLHRSPS